MDVVITEIMWYGEIPIATVIEISTGNRRRISLMHQSYINRYRIGIGSELHVSSKGFVEHVKTESDEVSVPKRFGVFTRWFLFRQQMTPMISIGVARRLFSHGIETLTDIQSRHDSEIGQIRGIGPVAIGNIRRLIESLPVSFTEKSVE
jgi:hypothetical protein